MLRALVRENFLSRTEEGVFVLQSSCELVVKNPAREADALVMSRIANLGMNLEPGSR